jgi:hypothetical protein
MIRNKHKDIHIVMLTIIELKHNQIQILILLTIIHLTLI